MSLGSASKLMFLIFPVACASVMPVATPSAVNTLAAKMPTRSGCAAKVEVTICAALAGVSPSYWAGSTVMFGYLAAISSLSPLCRASVVEMPGLTLTTITVPLAPTRLASASGASLPPSSLSEEIRETARELSVTVVSTSTI